MFKAKDLVRLVSGGGNYPLNGFYNGETYIVSNPKNTSHELIEKKGIDHFVVIEANYSRTGYAEPHQLVLVSASLDEIEKQSTKH